jgi:hypothetical protein
MEPPVLPALVPVQRAVSVYLRTGDAAFCSATGFRGHILWPKHLVGRMTRPTND